MSEKNASEFAEELFHLSSSRASQIAERFGLTRQGKWVLWRVVGLSLLVTWVPLVILATIQGVAWGTRVDVPLLEDFLPYGRYFLGVPILIAAEWAVGRRLGLAVAELRNSEEFDGQALETFDAVIARAIALWHGPYVMAVIVAAVYGFTLLTVFLGTGAAAGTWEHYEYPGKSAPSLAGLWQLLVSAALLRVLTYRWLWRWLIWAWVLWRIARLPIAVSPVHPDRAGGLGFLGSAQTGFAVLVLVISLQLACLVANTVSHVSAQLSGYLGHAVLLVIMSVVFVFAPLVVLIPRLSLAKWESDAPLSGWANRMDRYLEKKLDEGDVSRILSEAEISSITDYGALLTYAREMRIVPVSNQDLLVVVGAALLPVVPLLFMAMPAQEVLEKLLVVMM